MAKEKPIVETGRDMPVPFPVGGIDVSTSFDQQPPGTTPVGENVRAFDPVTQRLKGGSRPGLERHIDEKVAESRVADHEYIQHLDVLVDPSIDAVSGAFDADDSGGAYGDTIADPDGGWVRIGGSGQIRYRLPPKRYRIRWADPADITYGTALSGTQLNAVAEYPVALSWFSLAGSFVYAPASGTVLASGKRRRLQAVFTPTDTTYRPKLAKQRIDVTPLISLEQSARTDWVGANPITKAYSGPVTAGRLLVAVATSYDYEDVGVTHALTDTLGNTWVRAGSYARIVNTDTIPPIRQTLSLWYVANCLGGGDTVSLTMTGWSATRSGGLVIAEYSGIKTTSPLEGTSSLTGRTPGSGAPYSMPSGLVSASDQGLTIAGFSAMGGDAVGITVNEPFVMRQIEPTPSQFGFADEKPTHGDSQATFVAAQQGFMWWAAMVASFYKA